MVFAGVFLIDNDDFEDLREALENCSSTMHLFGLRARNIDCPGFGFRWLHWDVAWRSSRSACQGVQPEVITHRAERILLCDHGKGERMLVNTPSELPDPTTLKFVEPTSMPQIISKPEFIGGIA